MSGEVRRVTVQRSVPSETATPVIDSTFFVGSKILFTQATVESPEWVVPWAYPNLMLHLRLESETLRNKLTSEKPRPWATAPVAGATVSGLVGVTFQGKSGRKSEVGVFPLETPALYGLRLAIPLTPSVVRLLVESWTKGRLLLTPKSAIVALSPHQGTDAGIHLWEVPLTGQAILYVKTDHRETPEIAIEESVLEEIQSKVVPVVSNQDDLHKKLQDARELLLKGKTRDATLQLRILIMNHLTIPSPPVESGGKPGPRMLREEVRKSILRGFEGHALEIREDNARSIKEILASTLDILHRYSKTEGLESVPYPDIVEYVYNNIVAVIHLLEASS
ncbi:MAG: hypothetical protein KGJ23_16170 [Euryarchaeota archaeon]|nr:hypothetical protein [Euryarchaeota archaeon]MDE2045519.1 hypothetical protein [Thermoplasmata archaeon]